MNAVLAIALLGCLKGSYEQRLDLKTFSLEELIPIRREFFPEGISVQWTSDNEFIYGDSEGNILKYNAATDVNTTILPAYEVENFRKFTPSTFSKDGKYMLFTAKKQKVYRYSSIAEYYVYDLQTKSTKKLSEEPLQVVVWGAGGSLAYVRKNNVYYVHDATHPEVVTSLTTEGVPGEVYFGVPDWIYEEEIFDSAETMWFSPSGTHLAVAYFNDTNVETTLFPYYGTPLDLNNQYPHIVGFKYPKAGRTNPSVGLRVFKVDDTSCDAWHIPSPTDRISGDYILGRVNWASDNHLLVLWLNRRQNYSVLLKCTLTEDKCVLVKEQREPNGWIDIFQPIFNDNGTMMVEIGPIEIGDSRFLHAIRFNFQTFFYEGMSPLNGTVTQILGWNAEKDALYYIVSPRETPWERQMWTSTKSGTVLRCVTCRKLKSCNYVKGMFSTKASFGIVTCSASNLPPKVYLYNAEEDSFRLLLDNSRLADKLSHYHQPLALFNKINLADFVEAHVKLVLPPKMIRTLQYPMIVRVYAGPGTSRVMDNFEVDYPTYLAANRSFIVASIDVRGSGCIDLNNMFALNKAFGTVEVTDTLDAINKLITLYPFIDPKRIGVWGWSYGGYATTMMLIKDVGNTIACGAAVAPVTSWLYYDSIYTERYMDTPQENPEGYHRSDLIDAAEKLRGKKYFLVHGTSDDNVHFQHSVQLAKRLQHADISFEQMSYTDEDHSLVGVSRHFYHALDHFWTNCFSS